LHTSCAAAQIVAPIVIRRAAYRSASLTAPRSGRDDDGIGRKKRRKPRREQGNRAHRLECEGEEGFEAGRVRIDGQHPVGPDGTDQVGYHARCERLSGGAAAILARVAEVGDHERDEPLPLSNTGSIARPA
jgi:hypothetical protein